MGVTANLPYQIYTIYFMLPDVLSHLYLKLIGVEHENKNRIEDISNENLNI